jgi:membrane protein implicated in regulation of membrane protease activity
MADSSFWWVLAGGAVALELATGTFYLLMLALGMAAGAIAAHLGLSPTEQLVAAAVAGGGSVLAWRGFRQRRGAGLPIKVESNPDVNLDVGGVVHINAWQPDGTASVAYRGARWTAQLQSPGQDGAQGGPPVHSPPAPTGPHRIVAVVGSHLIVDKTQGN